MGANLRSRPRLVALPFSRARIVDFERPVFLRDELKPVGRPFAEIRNEWRWKVAVAGIFGSVKLPDVFEPGHVMQGLIGYQSPSLGRPVVHDRYSWLECRDC